MVRWIEAAVQRSLTVLAMRRKLPDFAENTVRYSCSWTDQDVLKCVAERANQPNNRSVLFSQQDSFASLSLG